MNTADEFLKQKHLFQLGDLPTETPHPLTSHLSEWAEKDLDRALQILREVDLNALRHIAGLKQELKPFFTSVADTLERGDRIYLVGCGATGRLSLSLEFLWRRRHPGSQQIISLMAGGDVALVHSLEGFEDFPEYGARHLRELGFSADDLLIGSTEGGETPYVIGAVEEAARASKRKPIFLYCNTPQILIDKVERSRLVLTNPKIQSHCLETGPMALTGSTRMQASTVLMLVIGLALEFGRDVDAAFAALESWINFVEGSPVAPLKEFVLSEAETYAQGDYTIYAVEEMAITAFTDTTERAPTFNLAPFDNPTMPSDRHSLTYITIPSCETADDAWQKLLARPPRALNWPEVHPKATPEYLQSFDFSRRAALFRKRILPDAQHHVFTINSTERSLVFGFRGLEARFALPEQNGLLSHLTLKMLLNMHSTLVMGRLKRFEGNLMTWVYPSNGKLIDRAARYTQILIERKAYGDFSYDEIVRAQFAAKADLSPSESIVHKTIKLLLESRGISAGQHGKPD
jgi:N-acetylmuramic acid 6-phosphate etherase